MTAHGTYATRDGLPAVVFERRLAHPVDVVWTAVTDPAGLARWFPCEVAVDLRVGGAMTFTFAPGEVLPGQVLELDPPRRFAFLWGDDPLTFELAPDGDGTRLTLTHALRTEGEGAAARTAAGWHVCLDLLGEHLDGRPTSPPSAEPTAEWQAHHDAYAARGFPAGAARPA